MDRSQGQELVEVMYDILKELKWIRKNIDSVDTTIDGNLALINKNLEGLASFELDKRFGDYRIPGALIR